MVGVYSKCGAGHSHRGTGRLSGETLSVLSGRGDEPLTTSNVPQHRGPWNGGLTRRWLETVTPFKVITVAVVAILGFLAAYPLGRIVVRLFWVGGSPTVEPLRKTLLESGLTQLIFNTVVVVAASSVLALFQGSVLAWLNERTNARIGVLTDALPLIPFLIPPVAGAIGWVLLLSPRAGFLNAIIRAALEPLGISLSEGPFDIYSWYGLIFVFTIYQVPYVFLLVSSGLRSLDPSLEEQSRISGASLATTLRRVTLPALGPSLGGAALLMAWQGFALFSVPVIIGSPAGIDVLSVRIVRLLTFTYPPETDIAIGLSVIVVLFVSSIWILQLRLLRAGRHATIGGKSHRASRIDLGRLRGPIRAFVLSYLAVAAVLPVTALVLVSLNGFWSVDIDWGGLSLEFFQQSVFGNSVTWRALTNSVSISMVTATVGMVAAALTSLFLLRTKGLWARGVDATIKLPAVVPNLVIAVGFLLAFSGPPFDLGGTVVILGMAYLTLYLPQGSVASDAAAGQVGMELIEASRISGAGRGHTFRKVHIPLMMSGLAVGWALLFARMVGDLTASSILSGTKNVVVGFRILDIYQNGSYAALAALTTVLVVITMAVIMVVFILQRRQARWGISTKTW